MTMMKMNRIIRRIFYCEHDLRISAGLQLAHDGIGGICGALAAAGIAGVRA